MSEYACVEDPMNMQYGRWPSHANGLWLNIKKFLLMKLENSMKMYVFHTKDFFYIDTFYTFKDKKN